jgi:hypothetical protein
MKLIGVTTSTLWASLRRPQFRRPETRRGAVGSTICLGPTYGLNPSHYLRPDQALFLHQRSITGSLRIFASDFYRLLLVLPTGAYDLA